MKLVLYILGILILFDTVLAYCPQPMPGMKNFPAETKFVTAEGPKPVAMAAESIDPAFDCRMRQLALQFSIASRGDEGAGVIAAALNLTRSGDCLPTALSSTAPSIPMWKRDPVAAAAVRRVDEARRDAPGQQMQGTTRKYGEISSIYVSTKGSDSTGDGSQSKPFASLQRAVEAVGSTTPEQKAEAAVPTDILMEPGTYYAPGDGTIIGPEASGGSDASPVRIRPSSAEGEVVLSGGEHLGRLPWKSGERGFRQATGRVNVALARALLAASESCLPQGALDDEAVAGAAAALHTWQELDVPRHWRRALPIDHSNYGNLLLRRPEGEIPGAEGVVSLGSAASGSACQEACARAGPESCLTYSHITFRTLSLALEASGADPAVASAVRSLTGGSGDTTTGGVCLGRADGVWSPYALPPLEQASVATSNAHRSSDGAAAAGSEEDVSGIFVDIYVADVAPLKSGRSISGLFFDGIGTASRATVARFPNGNDTQPMPLGWIQADGGWPDVAQDGAGTGKAFAYNTKVTDQGTGDLLSQGYIPGAPASNSIQVSPPAGEPGATYAKGSCREFVALEGGSLDRYNSTFNYPFWNSAVCEGMHFDTSTFTPRAWASWPGSEQPRVYMRQMHTWGSWGMLVAARTDSNESIVFATEANQEARGGGINKVGSGHGPEGGGNPFFVDRVREELDAPGEFYHDRAAGKLYFYPVVGQDIMQSDFVVPDAKAVVSMVGKYASSTTGADRLVTFVELHNLTIAHSRATYFDDFETPPGGDWAVHRGAMVFIDGAENVTVAHSKLQSPAGNGIMFSRHVKGSAVLACEIADAGESGILLFGASSGMDAFTREWQPTHNQIYANHVHDIGRIGKQAAPFFEGVAGFNDVSYNTFHDGPRAGYNTNPGLGGSRVHGNVLFNAVKETWDHGPTNQWGRQDWLHQSEFGATQLYPERMVMSNNLIMNVNYGLGHPNSDKCIDLDDGSSDIEVKENVAVYGGQKFRDGRFRSVHNNLLLYSETQDASFAIEPSLHLGPIGDSVNAHYTRPSDSFTNNTLVLSGGDFVGCNKGWTAANFPSIDYNTYITPNVSTTPFSTSGCCSDCGTWKGWQSQGYDVHSTLSSKASVEQLVRMASKVLGL